MSDVATARFTCTGCGKTYAWKPEIAGKRVKCKCGTVITVPQTNPTEQQEPEDLYDLAPDEQPAAPKRAPVVSPQVAAARAAAASSGSSSAALPYAGPPPRDHMTNDVLMDMRRDVHVPIALLAAGVILYIGYYAMKYHLTASGIAITSVGLFIMTAFKAAALVGFALVVANPLGVSFGGLWTAVLKLAACAVFCDGVTTWVDAFVVKISGGTMGSGIMGYGVLSFPVALGIYWVLLIYLFSMDPGDSWMVVLLLTFFDRIVKLALAFTLLAVVLRMGGISMPAMPGGSVSNASPLSQHVEELQDAKLLKEARAYIADGHQRMLGDYTEQWYKAGAKNVWFEVTRDFNGKTDPDQLIVEMPDNKKARSECLAIRKKFYDQVKFFSDPSELVDDGEQYMTVRIR